MAVEDWVDFAIGAEEQDVGEFATAWIRRTRPRVADIANIVEVAAVGAEKAGGRVPDS